MNIKNKIRSKFRQFSERGVMGYILAISFLIGIVIALTSPIWLLMLGFYLVGSIIN